MKNIKQAFQLALKNIRNRFFHTLLSMLGIIIGVAALVSILSLIDGLEKYAKSQIEDTTSLNAVYVSAPESETINKVKIKKENVEKFDYSDIQSMLAQVDEIPRYSMTVNWTNQISYDTAIIAANIEAIAIYDEAPKENEEETIVGQSMTIANNENKDSVAVINSALANLISSSDVKDLLDNPIVIGKEKYIIKGIVNSERDIPKIQIPASLITKDDMKDKRPFFIAQAKEVIALTSLQDQIQKWFDANRNTEDIKVEVNEFRIEQLEQGFLIFRLIMGMIVGISVIVGGVGIMNVMLITLKERTPEIGILKAIGAKRKDILSQFLAESVFVSLIGSAIGVLVGVVFTALAVPIVNSIIKQKGGQDDLLHVAFTFNTILIVATIAILIGILFGTYPAIRASSLKPVDAIQRV